MNYAIAKFELVFDKNLNLEIGASGNKFYVWFYNREKEELNHREFASMDEANGLFIRMVTLMNKSLGTYEDKKNEFYSY